MKIIIVLLLLLSTHCTSNKDLLSDFKQLKLAVDSTLHKKSLEVAELVNIEESESLILNDVYATDINFATNKIIVADPVNRSVNIYNYKTGSIINSVTSGLNLSDSLIYSGRIPLDHTLTGRRFRYLKNAEYEEFGLTQQDINLQKNRYFVPKFVSNDKIEILATIYAPAISEDNFTVLDNTAAIIKYDSMLNLKRVTVFENSLKGYSLSYAFLIDKERGQYLLTSSTYHRTNTYKLFDSLTAISLYDRNGNFIKVASYLPGIYETVKSGYKLQWMPKIAQINSKPFIAFPLDLTIYGINSQKRFNLVNLPYSNDHGFEYFKKNRREIMDPNVSVDRFSEIRDVIKNIFPINIVGLFSVNKNLIVRVLVYDDTVEGGYYYILQEYSPSGELLSQTNIYEDFNNKIHYVTFDNANNYLVLFKKSKDGWTMEKRKWQ